MGAAGAHDSYPPPDRFTGSSFSNYSYPGQYPAAYAAPPAHSRLEPDQIPLTREIDEFSNGFQHALGRIGEEDEGRNGDGNGGPFNDGLAYAAGYWPG